jgi:hypothetical protein
MQPADGLSVFIFRWRCSITWKPRKGRRRNADSCTIHFAVILSIVLRRVLIFVVL